MSIKGCGSRMSSLMSHLKVVKPNSKHQWKRNLLDQLSEMLMQTALLVLHSMLFAHNGYFVCWFCFLVALVVDVAMWRGAFMAVKCNMLCNVNELDCWLCTVRNCSTNSQFKLHSFFSYYSSRNRLIDWDSDSFWISQNHMHKISLEQNWTANQA